MSNNILIVDDEAAIRFTLREYFSARNYNVQEAADGRTALEILKAAPVEVVILDLKLPDISGLEVLKSIKSLFPGTGVVMITAYGDVETAVQAMQLRADNFALKPVDLSVLEAIVKRVLENFRSQTEVQILRRKVLRLEGSEDLKKLKQPDEVYHAIQLLTKNSSTNVLILGETGTGKGMVARIIHDLSDRKEAQFVDLNCAGLSGELLESELFGHEKGAFTDAKSFKRGLLEVANGGSLFLDEVAELSPAVQAKLLKVIEEKVFRRIGATANIKVDVRIMAATNTQFEKKVKEGRFREDLYFRLSVMPVVLPPLRERRGDIMPLARLFLEDFRKAFGRPVTSFTRETEEMLNAYSWPGNIRELRNVVERAVLLCEEELIRPLHLPYGIRGGPAASRTRSGSKTSLLSELEKNEIRKALAEYKDNQSQAAQALGIHRSTLIRKMKQYKIK